MGKHVFLSGNTCDGFTNFFGGLIDSYGLKRLYILKGGSGVGKSNFMQNFARFYENENNVSNENNNLSSVKISDNGLTSGNGNLILNGCCSKKETTRCNIKKEKNSIVYMHCSADPKSLDGVIIENKGVAIIDGTAPHTVDEGYPGVIETVINLGEQIEQDKLISNFKLNNNMLNARDCEVLEAIKDRIDAINAVKKECYKIAYAELAKAKKEHEKLEEIYAGAIDFKEINKRLIKLIKDVEDLK
jgi:hypothetical protein